MPGEHIARQNLAVTAFYITKTLDAVGSAGLAYSPTNAALVALLQDCPVGGV